MTHFSNEILQHIHLVPFLSLTDASLEKILRKKLQSLKKQLELSLGVELHYAPEIIKFLAREVLWQQSYNKSLDKVLEHYLYSCVSHGILAQDKSSQRKRLLLQLNDQGQLLRCEWAVANEEEVFI